MTSWVIIRSVLTRMAVVAALVACADALATPADADPGASATFRMFSVAGSGSARFGGDGGPATRAGLREPEHVAAMPDGGFLVSTDVDGRVRRVWPSGVITTVAGNGRPGFSGDGGPALRASMTDGPLVVAPDGGFWIGAGNRVRRVWPDGTVTSVAGSGHHGSWVEGAYARAAPLERIEGLALASDGSLLVSDANLYRIVRIGLDGRITTVAGTGERGDMGPDPPSGSPATIAVLDFTYGLAALPDGGALVAAPGDARVYRLTPDGRIVYAVGSGSEDLTLRSGLPALKTDLFFPQAVLSTSDGGLILATNDDYVAQVGPDGVLRRVAGIERDNTDQPFIGVGAGMVNGYGSAAREARTTPNDLALTHEGGVLIADPSANRVVYLAPAHTAQPAVAITAMRAAGHRVMVDYRASVAGTLQLGIFGHGRVVARAELPAARVGRVALRIGHARGLLEARVRLTPRGHVPVFDRSGIVVGRLSMALARAMAERDEMLSGYTPHVRRCARHSALRVDCEMRFPQLSARHECPAVLQIFPVSRGIQVRGVRCPKDRAHPFPTRLGAFDSETYTHPALASTYDYVFSYRRECLGPHTPGIHATNCRYGFGPGVRLGHVVEPAPKAPAKSPPGPGRSFDGTTSQGEEITFSYDPTAHTITDINTLLRFRCAGGERTAAAYGGFTVHVRADKTFSTAPNAHGYFRGHFVTAHLVEGRILLKPNFAAPTGCSSGHVHYTARWTPVS